MLERVKMGKDQLYTVKDIPLLYYIFEATLAFNRKMVEERVDDHQTYPCPCCIELSIDKAPTKKQEAEGNASDANTTFRMCMSLLCSDHLVDAARTLRVIQEMITAKEHYSSATLLSLLWSTAYCPPTHTACHRKKTYQVDTKKYRANTDDHVRWILGLTQVQLMDPSTKDIANIGGPRREWKGGEAESLKVILRSERGLLDSSLLT